MMFVHFTYKDQLPESSVDDTFERIDKQLQEKVRQISLFHQGLIEFTDTTDQLMFAVNNLDKDDSDFQRFGQPYSKLLKHVKNLQ